MAQMTEAYEDNDLLWKSWGRRIKRQCQRAGIKSVCWERWTRNQERRELAREVGLTADAPLYAIIDRLAETDDPRATTIDWR